MRLDHILRLLTLVALLATGLIAYSLQHFWGVGLAIAILVSVLAALGFVAALMAFQAWLSWLYGSVAPPDHTLRGLASLKPWWGEFLVCLHSFFWTQPFFGQRPLATGRDPDKPALLLIHGYFCNRGLWRGFAKWFAGRGHLIGSLNLEPVFGSIDDYPARIHQAVQDLCARLDRLNGTDRSGDPTKVVLIGHSMGGLAIRAYLRDYGAARVSQAITVGTPHQGTWAAQLGQGLNTRQMRLSTRSRPNPWLNHLRQVESPSSDGLFNLLLSHHDNIVFPQAIQRLGAAPVHEFSAMGHIQMIYEQSVREKILSIITQKESSRG
jgi:pimeloyl-ACP methyl ester carboxylesterase